MPKRLLLTKGKRLVSKAKKKRSSAIVSASSSVSSPSATAPAVMSSSTTVTASPQPLTNEQMLAIKVFFTRIFSILFSTQLKSFNLGKSI
jgi:hypothetical protein